MSILVLDFVINIIRKVFIHSISLVLGIKWLTGYTWTLGTFSSYLHILYFPYSSWSRCVSWLRLGTKTLFQPRTKLKIPGIKCLIKKIKLKNPNNSLFCDNLITEKQRLHTCKALGRSLPGPVYIMVTHQCNSMSICLDMNWHTWLKTRVWKTNHGKQSKLCFVI